MVSPKSVRISLFRFVFTIKIVLNAKDAKDVRRLSRKSEAKLVISYKKLMSSMFKANILNLTNYIL